MFSRHSLTLLMPLALALLTIATPSPVAAADADQPQYYELRTYLTKSSDQQNRINDYWQNAAIPAYNRMGIQPIGVFTETNDCPTNSIYVVIPCDSLEVFGNIPAKLAADTVYQQAAAGFLDAPKSDPAYECFSSALLVAFNGMKHLVVPPAAHKPNVFELRTYISSSDAKGLSKIKMFESGEITLMKNVGLAPIFYSRTVSGPLMPSLVYLTCGENPDAHKEHWQAFSDAPIWKALQADPQYKDNVSKVIRILLRRTSASQI
jgi:hypothetical protein